MNTSLGTHTSSRFRMRVLECIAIFMVALSQLTIAATPKEITQKTLTASGPIPRPDHIGIVIAENKSFRQIIGNMAAPYINRLANEGALFTNSFAIRYPSQPNYLVLFSGSTHGGEKQSLLDFRRPQ